MPVHAGTEPIAGAEVLAIRLENELQDFIQRVTYGRRVTCAYGDHQPKPSVRTFESHLVVNCYGGGERQELEIQLKDGVQQCAAAERITAMLAQWFPQTGNTAAEMPAPPSTVSPLPAAPVSAQSVPRPRDQLADHADFFDAHADLVEVMLRHPLSVVEEVWLRMQEVTEHGWEVTIEQGRTTFRRKPA